MFLVPTLCIPTPTLSDTFDKYYSMSIDHSLVRKMDDDFYRNRIVINEDTMEVFYPLDEKVKFLLSKFDRVLNKVEMQSYLLQNEDLLDLLNQSLEELKNYFPNDINVEASIIDNSMEDERNQVSVLVSSKSKDYLSDELDSFDYGWWLHKTDRADGRVVFRV